MTLLDRRAAPGVPLPAPDRGGGATTSAATTPARSARTVWSEVAPGFHVASRDGVYPGSVDAVVGGYVAMDSHGTPLGRLDTLVLARDAVLEAARRPATPRRRRRGRADLAVATCAGAAALVVALCAVVLAPVL